MEGKLKSLNRNKLYGFIKTDKADYFFHRDDFDGHWSDLCDDFDSKKEITMDFEPTRTSKGLRAAEVSRVDGGF
jgi:cold shock CspA family protein